MTPRPEKFVWSFFSPFIFQYALCQSVSFQRWTSFLWLTKAPHVWLMNMRRMCVGRYVLPHTIKQGGKKACGFKCQLTPGQEVNIWQDDCPCKVSQQKQMQISSRLDLLKFTLPTQHTSHGVFPTAHKRSIWRRLLAKYTDSSVCLNV